jgi:hypothetical protein
METKEAVQARFQHTYGADSAWWGPPPLQLSARHDGASSGSETEALVSG